MSFLPGYVWGARVDAGQVGVGVVVNVDVVVIVVVVVVVVIDVVVVVGYYWGVVSV